MSLPVEAVLVEARRRAGLTQAQLAQRMGTTQSAVARLERRGANPRIATLDRALRAAGHRLVVDAVKSPPAPLDENQLREHLRMTPAERARAHDAAYRNTRELVLGARRVDG